MSKQIDKVMAAIKAKAEKQFKKALIARAQEEANTRGVSVEVAIGDQRIMVHPQTGAP